MKINKKKDILFLVLASLIILVPVLFLRDFTPRNELKYIQIAKEMIENGKWFVLFENGDFYPDKPPFFFWLINLTKLISGRYSLGFIGLFSLIPSMILVLIAYFFTDKYIGGKYALASGFLLMTSPIFFISGACIRMDMLMTLFIVISLMLFFSLYKNQEKINKYYVYLMYISIGLAIYTKGPAGIIVPFLTILVFLFIEKRMDFLKKISFGKGFLLLIVMFLLWIIPSVLTGGKEYIDLLLIKQTVGRSVNSFAHKKAFYYYLLNSPLLFFYNFVLMMVSFFYYSFNIKKLDTYEKFLYSWFITSFIFFSIISSKLYIYLLPIVFPIILLSINLLKKEFKWKNKLLFLSSLYPSIITIIAAIYVFFSKKSIEGLEIKDFLPGAILASVFCILAVYSSRNKKNEKAIILISFSFIVLILNAGLYIPKYNPIIGIAYIANKISEFEKADSVDKVISYKFNEAKYMGVYNDKKVEGTYDMKVLKNLIDKNNNIIILSKKRSEKEMKSILNIQLIYKNEKYLLYKKLNK